MKLSPESTFWSALTSQRFGRLRPVAAVRLEYKIRRNAKSVLTEDDGDKSPKTKAVTGGVPGAAAALGCSRHRTPKTCALVLLIAIFSSACAANQGRRSIPPEVESTISTINEEIAAERYDKVYHDASELWRQDATLEESTATFKTLRTRLGKVESRTLQSATEQENSGGPLKGRAYIMTYRTTFQNGAGMETFTLVERNGRWLLARYLVNSTALK
jgi:hypothetical protein